MSTRPRIVLATVLVVIVGALIAVAAYLLHHPDRYLPEAIAYLQKKTGKQIEIRHVTIRLFPLSLRLYDVRVKNPKPFPPGYFLEVPSVDATIDVGPLLHRKIAIDSLVLNKPVVNFISDPDGLWNFQNPVLSKTPVRKPPRFSMGAISRLEIKKGVLLGSALIDPADTPGPIVLEIRNFSAKFQQINFDALNGPSSSGVVEGKLDADTARFGDIHLKNLHSHLRILPKQLTFKNFHAKTYRGQASGDFTFNFSQQNPKFDTDLQVSGIGVPYLLQEFQPGPTRITGMMQADLKLAGEIEHSANPLAGTSGGGHFTIRKGELPSLNQNKQMAQMKRFRSTDAAALPPSSFSSFAGDLELRNHHIYNRKLGMDFYGIDVGGSGNIDELNGDMDYRGVAVILKKQGFFMKTFARLFKGAELKNGRLTFPIRVAGTLSNPIVSMAKKK